MRNRQAEATGRRGSRARERDRGQILPLMAGGLVTMLILVGLVIDTGVAFKERRTAQNTSDLAAMAGTRVIAEWHMDPWSMLTGVDVWNAVNSSAAINGCTDPCTWIGEYTRPNGGGSVTVLGPLGSSGAIPATAQGVRVTTNRSPGTFFIRIIGQDHWNVGATATAMSSRLANPPPGILLPIGIFDADYQMGQVYTLTAGDNGPGNFGWLSWGGSPSETVLGNSVCGPDNPAFNFPTWFSGSTGVTNSSDVRRCIDDYIANQTVVYIPIWRQTNNSGGSTLTYEITGAAAFVLTHYDQNAVEVQGRFVEFYSYPGVQAGTGLPPCSATSDPNCIERTNFIGLVQ
jgi:hypothetical protein